MKKLKNKNGQYKVSQDVIFDICCCGILILIGIVTLYPIYFIGIASISDSFQVAQGQVLFYPKDINFDAYEQLWGNVRVWTGYRNSLFYTFFGTFLNLCVTIPAGYALSRPKLFGKKYVMLFFVFTMYFSGGLMPTYLLIRDLHMIDTIWSVLLPKVLNVFNLIIVKSFFEGSIPEALYEAAYLDGCNHFKFFFRVVIQVSPAIIAVMVLYYALANWNTYFDAMLYISDENIQTLQVIIKGITSSMGAASSENLTSAQLTEIMKAKELVKYAVVIVATIPVLILYPFVQKFFVKGVMIGAVKG